MIHPPTVCKKAQRLECLLQRVEAGEPLDWVYADLDLSVKTKEVPKLQARYKAGGRSWEAFLDGRCGHPQKAHSALREWIYERKREDETLTARELASEIAKQFQTGLTIGHINCLLRKVELTRPPGRPPQRGRGNECCAASTEASAESLDNAGLFFPRRSKTGDGRGRDRGELPGDGR